MRTFSYEFWWKSIRSLQHLKTRTDRKVYAVFRPPERLRTSTRLSGERIAFSTHLLIINCVQCPSFDLKTRTERKFLKMRTRTQFFRPKDALIVSHKVSEIKWNSIHPPWLVSRCMIVWCAWHSLYTHKQLFFVCICAIYSHFRSKIGTTKFVRWPESMGWNVSRYVKSGPNLKEFCKNSTSSKSYENSRIQRERFHTNFDEKVYAVFST